MKSIFVGSIEIFLEESENYLQINDVGAEDIRELWFTLKDEYRRYEVNLCYHDTPIPHDFLREIRAVIIDNCTSMRLVAADFIVHPDRNVIPITKVNFASFAALHDTSNPDMYWTSRRLQENMADWRIFAYQLGQEMIGYTLMNLAMHEPTQAEIYCCVAHDSDDTMSLLSAAAEHAFKASKAEVLFMPDVGSLGERIAQSLGFKTYGSYQGYAVKL